LRIAAIGIAVALCSACASSTPSEGDSDAGAVPAVDASPPNADARPVVPSARGEWCAVAGRAFEGDLRVTLCTGPVDLVTEERKQGDVTWRPGPIYVVEPSGGQ
jgi:hypothetical protein